MSQQRPAVRPSAPPSVFVWMLLPANHWQYVMAQAPQPFPPFDGDQATAYQYINTQLGLGTTPPNDLRSQYTVLTHPWATWSSDIQNMARPSTVPQDAWQKVQDQLHSELLAVQTVQGIETQWGIYSSTLFADEGNRLNQLASDAGIEQGSTLSIGGAILQFFTGMLYTALSANEETAVVANLIQAAINIASANPGSHSVLADPFQVAYSELWDRLNSGFEAMISSAGTLFTSVLTDYGKLTLAYELSLITGPYSVSWSSDMTANLVTSSSQGYQVSAMQMLLPAKYQIYKYSEGNSSPVSGVPDYAQWIETGGNGTYYKYWIADSNSWSVYPSQQAIQNDVFNNQVSTQDFFKCFNGWGFSTAFAYGYEGVDMSGFSVLLTNNSPDPLVVTGTNPQSGSLKGANNRTLWPYQSTVIAMEGDSIVYGPTVTIVVMGNRLYPTLPAVQFDVHMKPSIFTGATPQVTVTQANTLGLFNIVSNTGSQANGYSSAVQVTLSPIAP